MSTHPTVIIVNELSGGGATADLFRRIEHPLMAQIGDFDIRFTEAPGHATELTRDALKQGVTRILVAGGDGTLHECVQGFFDEGEHIGRHARLGLLNGGTGGDFRRSLGLHSPEDVLQTLADDHQLCIDLGFAEFTGRDGLPAERYFINVASFALSGRVVEGIDSLRHLGGKAAYFGATLKSLWGWRNPLIRARIDERPPEERSVTTVAIGNGRFFGGGMQICPDALLSSGHFQICTLGDLKRLEILMLSRQIYEGRHTEHPKIQLDTLTQYEAEPLGLAPIPIDIDGEALGTLPLRVRIIPQALNLIVPAAILNREAPTPPAP